MVKELRDASGSGVMDAKRALEEAEGDMTQAAAILRERGLAAAAKRAERETGQGVVDTYIHAGGRIGALVEVNCETDFVANTDEFRSLVHEIAMQVAAMNPAVVSADDREPGREGADDEVALLSQPWVKDASKTISDLVQDSMAKTGENIRVRRFARFELGS
ncbi:MAG: elongation factor Ts [Dehalococcoidia bacterium]|nr:elongation factor Ts [Dehalococcoidia bacterium]